ncbi:MAG: hypothetical protein JW730_18255 [Anaerolineales bacterium]|nr:hypothetical protein [Anaerolineales bacterium]
MKYQLDGNTYFGEAKSDPHNRISLEIGDATQPDKFYPHVKLSRWDGEVYFGIGINIPVTVEPVNLDGDKLSWKNLSFYPIEPSEACPEGGYEFEVTLPEKPTTNVLNFTIQAERLAFFYQPELTEEQKARGDVRPDNVVGSYAVYHFDPPRNVQAGQVYGIGKAFHIYRPEAIDAHGQRTWCDLSIDAGVLRITVPQAFLQSAAYPVVIDPTFGYTTTPGTAAGACYLNHADTIRATLSEDGDVSKLSMYGKKSSPNAPVKGLLFDDDGSGGEPSTIKGATQITTWDSTTPSWKDLTYATPVSLTAGNWWMGFVSGIADGIIFYYDAVDWKLRELAPAAGYSYASPGNWLNGSDTHYDGYTMGIYATYEGGSVYNESLSLGSGAGAVFGSQLDGIGAAAMAAESDQGCEATTDRLGAMALNAQADQALDTLMTIIGLSPNPAQAGIALMNLLDVLEAWTSATAVDTDAAVTLGRFGAMLAPALTEIVPEGIIDIIGALTAAAQASMAQQAALARTGAVSHIIQAEATPSGSITLESATGLPAEADVEYLSSKAFPGLCEISGQAEIGNTSLIAYNSALEADIEADVDLIGMRGIDSALANESQASMAQLASLERSGAAIHASQASMTPSGEIAIEGAMGLPADIDIEIVGSKAFAGLLSISGQSAIANESILAYSSGIALDATADSIAAGRGDFVGAIELPVAVATGIQSLVDQIAAASTAMEAAVILVSQLERLAALAVAVETAVVAGGGISIACATEIAAEAEQTTDGIIAFESELEASAQAGMDDVASLSRAGATDLAGILEVVISTILDQVGITDMSAQASAYFGSLLDSVAEIIAELEADATFVGLLETDEAIEFICEILVQVALESLRTCLPLNLEASDNAAELTSAIETLLNLIGDADIDLTGNSYEG